MGSEVAVDVDTITIVSQVKSGEMERVMQEVEYSMVFLQSTLVSISRHSAQGTFNQQYFMPRDIKELLRIDQDI